MSIEAAWSNAVFAFPNGPWSRDLATAVSNSGDLDDGARWALVQAANWASTNSPIEAYDSIISTVEALNRFWPVMEHTAELMPIEARSILPLLARFIFERIPAVVQDVTEHGHGVTDNPVTKVVVVAERAHDLVGLFAAGLKPNGSKDPYALRRAAKHFLAVIMTWVPTRQFKEIAA